MAYTGGIVVAGSRPFVRAVATAFRQRHRVVVGIAGETERAFILANASGGLFVFEHGGEPWRALLEELQEARAAGLRIVAAIPDPLRDEAPAVEAAGADLLVTWDGDDATPVVDAGESLLAEREARREPPPRPSAPPVLQRVAPALVQRLAPPLPEAPDAPSDARDPAAPTASAEGAGAEEGSGSAPWDPRARMAPCARIVTREPSRWSRLGRIVGSLFAAAAAGLALLSTSG
ncbi:hypothetical protein [Anaeromyxobacter paludicola]|uniref:Uncharacterized protein n=1 Tax=Anaeromyxobacter paludicola TaxID=2918171 RepID=A0ABM7X575_9BACT|nr:hypothetical protein [Anaeromyxobacter paludicola]BDG06963.1 hypothetical protein AMPC_00760 [Anaeromyxobacter paludicola]